MSVGETGTESIDSIIGAGNHFKGEFKLSGALRVDGVIEGILLTNSRIHISKLGRGKGKISAKSIEIGGEFEGELEASNNVIIKSTAFVTADITSGLLMIEDGAYFSGRCNINPTNLEKIVKTTNMMELETSEDLLIK